MSLFSRVAVTALALMVINASAQTEDLNRTDFNKADSIAALYPDHSLKDLQILTYKLTGSLPTEESKFRAIYKWVCDNIAYDYNLYLKNKYKREKLQSEPDELNEWNKKLSSLAFKKLLEQHQAVCTGYAYLVKELASLAGIPCVIVDGYGRTAQANIGGQGNANHSWNAVRLHNNWYLCDATWSSGFFDPEHSQYIRSFDDSYFLASPSLFARNHYPLDTKWLLLDHNKPSLHEFLNAPLIYKHIFRYDIDQLQPTTFNVTALKGESISFHFKNNGVHDLEKVALLVKSPGIRETLYPEVHKEMKGDYRIDHVFTTKGTHTVHILINSGYAFTYTVKII